jgi:threonine/homoserine/homoserine lactone efflux protein
VNPLLAGVIAGFGIAIPVGAIAVLIVQVGIRCGFWCAASAGAGAATADLVYSVLAVVGGTALAATIESAGAPLRYASAAVLATIAVVGLARARREPEPSATPLPGRREFAATYGKFLGLTIVNPLTVVYFAAVVLGLGLADGYTTGQTVLFATGAFAASLSWQTMLAGIGAVVRHRLPGTFATGAAVVGNVIILGMAGLIVLR